MQILRTWAELAAVPADPDLRRLLDLRRDQLMEHGELSDLGCIAIIQPHDTIDAIETALGFSIATDPIDGARYPDPAFTPAWEWIEHHGAMWEMPFVLSDDGAGFILIVPDDADIDGELLAMIRAFTA